jgi:molecular chaperone GrpE
MATRSAQMNSDTGCPEVNTSGNAWQRFWRVFHRERTDAVATPEFIAPLLPPIEEKLNELHGLLRPINDKLARLSYSISNHWQQTIIENGTALASTMVDEPDLATSLTPLLKPIADKLESLERCFEAKIQDDATKVDLFNRLHQDLIHYRDDFVFKQVTGKVFDDLILLFDRLDDTLEPETLQNLDREALIDRMQRFQQQIRKTLKRHGVSVIAKDAERFDESFQEAINSVPVESPEENGIVLSVRRQGFEYQGKVLRPAKVVIGRYLITDKEQKNG